MSEQRKRCGLCKFWVRTSARALPWRMCTALSFIAVLPFWSCPLEEHITYENDGPLCPAFQRKEDVPPEEAK